jgi:hypothetical protein
MLNIICLKRIIFYIVGCSLIFVDCDVGTVTSRSEINVIYFTGWNTRFYFTDIYVMNILY